MIDSVGDFFHFDSKFFRTLGKLAFRPGFLTAEYLHGKRASYFEPFRMFLFISLLYFIGQGLVNSEDRDGRLDMSGNRTENIRFTLNDQNQVLFTMPVDSLRMAINRNGISRLVDLNYPRQSWVVRFFIKQMVRNRIKGYGNLSETFTHTLSRLVFVLIPLFALLLKVIFIRTKIPYFNHAIFSLHLVSFVFLLLLADLFLSKLSGWFTAAALVAIMVYLFLAMKNVYRPGRFRAFAGWAIFLIGSGIVLGLFFILVMSVSIMMV